jgi:hypothetical protein
VAVWLDGRDTGLVAGLVAIWTTLVIRKVATGSAPSLLPTRQARFVLVG